MKFRHRVEYAFVRIISFIIMRLTLDGARKMGALCGAAFYRIGAYRRDIIRDNISKAYPDKTPREVDSLAIASFRSIGIAFFEMLWFPKLTPERIRDIVVWEKGEIIESLLKKGKGGLFLAAHYGNWEMIAQSFHARLGIPLHIIVKRQSNKLVDDYIDGLRTRFGSKTIAMDNIREVFRVLSEGGAIGIVGDQSGSPESAWVPFFGREVPTHQGPALFCLKTGAPLVLCFPVRQSDGRYTIRFFEVPSDDIHGHSKEQVLELTRRHVAMTEELIREHPEQWMWMHKRWKHARQ